MASNFDFKQYQKLKITWRMLIRLLIYSIVIGALIYLILENKKEEPQNTNDSSIESFDIELEAPQSE